MVYKINMLKNINRSLYPRVLSPLPPPAKPSVGNVPAADSRYGGSLTQSVKVTARTVRRGMCIRPAGRINHKQLGKKEGGNDERSKLWRSGGIHQ